MYRLNVRFDIPNSKLDFKGLTNRLNLIKRKDIAYSAYLVGQFIQLTKEDAELIARELNGENE